MGRKQDGRPRFGQRTHNIDDAARIDGIESAERLIQNQQGGLVDDRADELDLLGHPLGDVGDLLVPPAIDLKPLEPHLERGDGLGPVHALEPGEIDGLLPHLHVAVQPPFLGEVSDAPDRFAAPWRPVQFDGPAIGLDDAHDAPDERGFARAVGPEQAEDGALRHVESDAIEHLLFTERFPESRDAEGVGHGVS